MRVELYEVLDMPPTDTPIVETDLTDEERAMIREGRAEYARSGGVPLASVI